VTVKGANRSERAGRKACIKEGKGYSKGKKKCVKTRKPNIQIIIKNIKIYCPAKPRSVRIKPVVKRYFYIPDEDIELTGDRIRLHANQFVDDHGERVARFAYFGRRGYVNLFINGALQEGKLYQVKPDALTIIPTGQTIYKGTPIIIESVGFLKSGQK
jgi:hypothetical protein